MIDAMSSDTLRVLAVACKKIGALPENPSSKNLKCGMTCMRLVGMIDPPRSSLESWGSCSRGIYASIRVGMLVLNFPCATMTGAVIRAFMILTVSPVKAIVFLGLIVILQQLEGNLIYPRVVGASLGLPAIWVLTAIALGGGLLGVPGMLLCVPLAAALYRLVKEDVNRPQTKECVKV